MSRFANWIVALVTFVFITAPALATESDPVVIIGIRITNAQAVIAWTGGRPTYQVQMRTNLSGNWLNISAPLTRQSATVPITGNLAYFRVVSDFTARYQVRFDATWSQATHPEQWTTNAHWSGLVGGTHNGAVHFFRQGEAATEGIRLMAEQGQKTQLLAEIAPAITNGSAQLQLSGGGIRPSPGTVTYVFPEAMRRDFPLVTLVSMVAPSPDWFVGVDSLNLLQGGHWVTNLVVPLYAIDAGTDSGVTSESPDQPS